MSNKEKNTKKAEEPKSDASEQERVIHTETALGDEKDVTIPPTPENPIANQLATGIVPGISGESTEPGVTQDSEDAKQPDIKGEINESVVNPVAPPVEPQGVPEAVIREVAVPNAQEEPTFHDGADYNRLKAAFERALGHGNFDVDFARTLRKEAGVL